MSTPSKIATVLREIADKIDRSKRPDRTLVAAELRKVLATVNGGAPEAPPPDSDDQA